MGYYIEYTLKLAIRPKHFKRALEIFNDLHTPEMLDKYARGGCFGSDGGQKWYSWVNNPTEPYETLKEAFENWSIVEQNVNIYIDEDTQDFVISGGYDDKLGQQDFLIEQLAPVLRNTRVNVVGEDGEQWSWIIENHKYRYEEHKQPPEEELSDDDLENFKPENMKLAGIDIY